jgi:hypothetical protein
VALEQRHAQARFQLAHVVADRAGGEVQFFAGVGEILVPRRGFEGGEGGQELGSKRHRDQPQI